MKKIYFTIICAIAAFSACDEFEPAFTDSYPDYRPDKIYSEKYVSDTLPATVYPGKTLTFNRITISDLKSQYEATMSPIDLSGKFGEFYVKGQVVSSDSTGNFYKSIFIQDETSGMELKLGKYNLYNEYKIGQWVYVWLRDLTVGAYYGSIQLGFQDQSGDYETSYLEVQRLIDAHVFRGEMGTPVQPKEITASDLKSGWKARCCGTLVKLKGMTYGNEIFCLVYRNPNLPSDLRDKNHAYERIFLSDQTWGVTTWAMSSTKFEEYLNSGVWDKATQASPDPDASTVKTVAQMRANNEIKSSAYTVSQYFKFQGMPIGVRSSGYSKFCDSEIAKDILEGRSVDMTGVITYYSSSSEFQFTFDSPESVTYSEAVSK